MVGGEICTDTIWCNDYSNKTLITHDGGNSFEELAPLPTLLKGHCAVFIDNNTLMVIGGYKFPASYDKTYFLDLASNVWTDGPPLTTNRAYHTCNIVTDCRGNKQVVVVGGYATGVAIPIIQTVEIYDIDSQTWSAGTVNLVLRRLIKFSFHSDTHLEQGMQLYDSNIDFD